MTHKPDIVLGTESFLNKTFTNSEIFPAGYTAIRNDRDCNGGGVFIAYRKDLILTEQEGPRNRNMKVECLYANFHIISMPAAVAKLTKNRWSCPKGVWGPEKSRKATPLRPSEKGGTPFWIC